MANIAIVTDSSADIPEKLAKENDITVVPMYIGIEGKMYKEEIDSLGEFLIKRSKFFAVLENFKYVFRGGRAPFLGKFLSVAIRFKPILTIGINGKVQLKGSAKNRKGAIYKIYRQIKKEASCKGKKIFGIFYGSDIRPALELKKMIEDDNDIDVDELILTEITAIMSAHTGPGVWGAAVCLKA